MKEVNTGDVYRFKLPIMGYGYGRITKYSDASNKEIYLVKVYDHEQWKEEDGIDLLKEKKYLLQPLLLRALPNKTPVDRWRYMGNVSSIDHEEIPLINYYEKNGQRTQWQMVINSRTVKPGKMQPGQLEDYHIYSSLGIEARTSMEILKRQKKKITTYLDLSKGENQFCFDKTYEPINLNPGIVINFP